MNLMEPQPNLARQQQIFQIWIRPVETPNAVFALRAALFELNKLVKEGIPPAEFERTRGFLSKFVNVLTKTKSAELGYAIDSLYYGIPEYNEYLKAGLARLTVDDVNRAVRRHLRAENMQIVGVAKDAAKLQRGIDWPGAHADPLQFSETAGHSRRGQNHRALAAAFAGGGCEDRAGGERFRELTRAAVSSQWAVRSGRRP